MIRNSRAKTNTLRNRIAATVSVLIAVPLCAMAAAVSTSPVWSFLPEVPFGGESTLIRTPSGVSFHMSAPTIPDGHAVTIWAVVFNNPAGCYIEGFCGLAIQDFLPGNEAMSDTIGPVAGRPVGKGKNARFAGNLREGDASASINPLFGLGAIGMLDSDTAEIHLVVRSHGPKIPGMIDEQIGSYEGGCLFEVMNFGEVPDEENECGDFLFSVHLAPE